MHFLPFLILLTFFSSFAHALQPSNPFLSLKENQTLNLSYAIYSSGFKIAEQNIIFSRKKTQLFFSSVTSSTGIASAISDITYTSELIANILPHALKITSYRILVEQGVIFTKKDASYIHYNKDNSNTYHYIPIENIEEDEHPPSFDKQYSQNSIPWPALIPFVATASQENINICNISWKIFDVGSAGKMTFSSPKKTYIPEDAYTKYTGKAQKCTISYQPAPNIPSPLHKKIDTEPIKGNIYTATVLGKFRFPIKFFLPQKKLSIIMHLIDYHITDNNTHPPFQILSHIPLPP